MSSTPSTLEVEAPSHRSLGAPTLPVLSVRVAYGFAFATGILYFLAFPGVDYWPLSFVTWVPLLLALHGRSVRTAAGLGWVSGFTMTFVGFYWILEMLERFSGFATAWCVVLMALLAAFQGGRIAFFGFLYARAVHNGWSRGLSFALAFAVSEHLFPVVFVWYFGATLHSIPWLTQVAELGNPIAVGLVSCLVNYAVAEHLLAHLEQRRKPWRPWLVATTVVGAALSYGAFRIHQVEERTREALHGRVGIVQANLGLMQKREDPAEGLRRHLTMSQALESDGPLDLIIWPETAVAGAVDERHAEAVYRQQITRHLQTPVLFGALLRRKVSDARGYTLFNSALITDAEGGLAGRYDKQRLLAFGEYLPLGERFPILYEWSRNSGRFTPGRSQAALRLGEHRLSTHVCYEGVLPSLINQMLRQEPADLLVNLTNDAWYGDTTQPWIHLALTKFRAIEHRRFLVRATNSGVSAVIDAVGRVQAHTGTFERRTLTQKVAYLRLPATPYERWGDTPWWLACGALAYACMRPAPWRRGG